MQMFSRSGNLGSHAVLSMFRGGVALAPFLYIRRAFNPSTTSPAWLHVVFYFGVFVVTRLTPSTVVTNLVFPLFPQTQTGKLHVVAVEKACLI